MEDKLKDWRKGKIRDNVRSSEKKGREERGKMIGGREGREIRYDGRDI